MLRAIHIAMVFILGMHISLMSYAAGDSIKIGISIEIKAQQQCDYDYSIENLSSSNNNHIRSSSCNMTIPKLQQYLNQISYSTSNDPQIDGDGYRVLITVQ